MNLNLLIKDQIQQNSQLILANLEALNQKSLFLLKLALMGKIIQKIYQDNRKYKKQLFNQMELKQFVQQKQQTNNNGSSKVNLSIQLSPLQKKNRKIQSRNMMKKKREFQKKKGWLLNQKFYLYQYLQQGNACTIQSKYQRKKRKRMMAFRNTQILTFCQQMIVFLVKMTGVHLTHQFNGGDLKRSLKVLKKQEFSHKRQMFVIQYQDSCLISGFFLLQPYQLKSRNVLKDFFSLKMQMNKVFIEQKYVKMENGNLQMQMIIFLAILWMAQSFPTLIVNKTKIRVIYLNLQIIIVIKSGYLYQKRCNQKQAYAKIHGDYFKLKNGSQKKCENALIDLTGCPVEKIKLDSNSEITTIQNYKNNRGYLMNLQKRDQQKDTTGFAYYINRIERYKDVWLFNIRDIWENLNWEKDWSNGSELWDDAAKKQLNPKLDDPKQTWMKFENVKEEFKFINVCKIQDWNEVRIKGKFVKVVDTNDSSIETFMSKWYYQFEVTENCLQKANNNIELIITLHQEDELIKGVEQGRPYLDVQLALFKLIDQKQGLKNDNDSKKRSGNENDYYKKLHHTKFTLINISNNQFQHERQIELSFQIKEKGIYIILPRTNGLGFRESKDKPIKNLIQKKNDKQSNNSGQNQENKAENLKLSQLLESTLLDIFRKFDMRLTRKMSEQQFVAFKYCMEEDQGDEQEFRKEFYDLLEEYPSPDKCLSQEGFIQYMTEKIKNDQNQNTESFIRKFNNIGYDKSLYSIRSRCFIISLHSDVPLEVIVRDAIETDLDQRAARHVYDDIKLKGPNQIITQFCKDSRQQQEQDKSKSAYVYAQYFKEANYTTFIAKNQMRDKAVEVIFDLSKTKNDLILSTGKSILKKKVEFKPPKQKDINFQSKDSKGKKLNSNNISIEVLFHLRGPFEQELDTFRRICQVKECED
ncbi:hypothetical protein ABPG72_004058 [Tetrahymena utriculariae]